MKEMLKFKTTLTKLYLTNNVSCDEHFALKRLKQMNNLIIKKADKGNRKVLMTKQHTKKKYLTT